MYRALPRVIAICAFFGLIETPSVNAAPQGFVKGRLKIVSYGGVELDGENSEKVSTENYADYPLIILSRGEGRLITRVTTDSEGNYGAALPAGDYVLDVEGREARRLRAKAEPFTVVPSETVRVNMTILTAFGDEPSRPQE